MTSDGSVDRIHSMSTRDRAVALEVLASAWALVREPYAGSAIADAVRTAADALRASDPSVDADYSKYAGEAALWYLDRAVRRIADADRSGLTATRREQNLAWFGANATPHDVERLFAMAAALDADDA